jgi:hypothetical protein
MTCLWAVWMLGAQAAPCDVDQDVMAAYGALVKGELPEAERALGSAEKALGCAAHPSDPQSLGRFWLVEGALLAATGDPEASVSFAAARRVAPELWLPDLGETARRLWDGAAPEGATGKLALDLELFWREATVDGEPWDGEPVPAGLHALQLQEADGRPCYGAMIYVGAGTVTNVTTGLPPEAPPPEAPRPPRTGSPLDLALEAELATGASLVVGTSQVVTLPEGTLREPGVKLVLPLMLSGRVRRGDLWAQLEGGVGWLVAGPYLSVNAEGELHRTSLRLDTALGGGADIGPIDLGLLTGIQWPGRLSERLVASFDLPASADLLTEEPLSLGIRAGFNLATDRPIEPGLEVLVGARLR